MSEKLQQDHFKVTPKKHDGSKASPPDGGGDLMAPEQYLPGRGTRFNTKKPVSEK